MSIVTDFIEKRADLLQDKLNNNPALGKSLIECLAALNYYVNENNLDFTQEETSKIVEQGLLTQAQKEEQKAKEAEKIIDSIAKNLEQKAAANQNVPQIGQDEVFVYSTVNSGLVKVMALTLNDFMFTQYQKYAVETNQGEKYFFVFNEPVKFERSIINEFIVLPNAVAKDINNEIKSVSVAESNENSSKRIPIQFALYLDNNVFALRIIRFITHLTNNNVEFELFTNTKYEETIFLFNEPYFGISDNTDMQLELIKNYEEQSLISQNISFANRPNVVKWDVSEVIAQLTGQPASTQVVAQHTLAPNFASSTPQQNNTADLHSTEEEDLERIKSILSSEEIEELEKISEIEDEDLDNLDDLLDI
jgi:hypothetical protein